MISSQGITTFVTFKISGLSSMPSPININNTSILLGKTTILTNLTMSDDSNTVLNNTTNKGSLYVSGNITTSSSLRTNDLSTSNVTTFILNSDLLTASSVNTTLLGTSLVNSSTINSSLINTSMLSSITINTTLLNTDTLNITNLSSYTVNSSLLNTTTLSSYTVNSSLLNTSNLSSVTVNSSLLNTSNLSSVTINSSLLNTSNLSSITINSSLLNTSDLYSVTINSSLLNTTTLSSYTVNSSLLNTTTLSSNTINSSLVNTTTLNTNILNVSGKAILYDDLEVSGNLIITGTTTSVISETVNIKDNVVLLNSNATGTPPSTLVSGIEVNRGGSLPNYRFAFVESDQTFKVGMFNDNVSELQTVSTREDSPIVNAIPYWNSSAYRFDTTNNIKYNSDNNSIIINNLNVSGLATISNLYVDGSSTINTNLNIEGELTASTTTVLNGLVSIKSQLHINDNISTTGTLYTPSGQVATLSGTETLNNKTFSGTTTFNYSSNNSSNNININLHTSNSIIVTGSDTDGNGRVYYSPLYTNGSNSGIGLNYNTNADNTNNLRSGIQIKASGETTWRTILDTDAHSSKGSSIKFYTYDQSQSSNSRLGMTTRLEITNLTTATGLTAGTVQVTGGLSVSDKLVCSSVRAGASTMSSNLNVSGIANLNVVNISGTGNTNILLINTSASILSATVTSTLSVLASITSNELNISNNTSLMTATVTSSLSVLGPVTISNNSSFVSGTFTSNLSVLGSLTVDTLTVTNKSTIVSITITSCLSVLETSTIKNIISLNDSTFNSNLVVLGSLISNSFSTINSDLFISNNLTTNSESVKTNLNIGTSLTVFNANINGTMTANTTSINSQTISTTLNVVSTVSVLGPLVVSGVTYLQNNLEIAGNLTVNGTTTAVNAETVNIKDNLIVINSSQTGTPSSSLQGGIEIERGDLNNYRFVFVESDDSFKIGVYNNTVSDLQSVATRENVPTAFGIPYWNSTASRFDTNSNLIFDTNTNSLSFNNLTLSDMTCTNTLTIGSATTALGPFTSSTRTILRGATSIMSALFIDGITTCKSSLTTPNISIGTTISTFNINMNGGTGSNINFKFASTDHAVGYYGGAKTWNSINVDGPVLYGYQGGLLGFSNGGASTTQGTSIRWDPSNVTIVSQLNVSNGIKFPSVSGATSLVLTTYAEGTWTPSCTFGTFTLSTRYGSYTRIGRTVHLMCQIIWSAKSGSGSFAITGVPFTPLTYRTGVCFGYIQGLPNYQIVGTFSAVNSDIYIRKVVSGSATDVTVTELGSTGEVNFTLTYFV